MAGFNVDHEIARVEGLYRQLTGSEPRRGDVPFAPIPPEANAEHFVRENLARLQQVLVSAHTEHNNAGAMPQHAAFAPRITVLESETEWACEIDVPGVERSDLHVQVQLNKLLVAGLRRDGVSGLTPVHVETNNGRFDRVLPLPIGVDTESASAKLDRGVLNVKFQKNAKSTQRDIRVDIN